MYPIPSYFSEAHVEMLTAASRNYHRIARFNPALHTRTWITSHLYIQEWLEFFFSCYRTIFHWSSTRFAANLQSEIDMRLFHPASQCLFQVESDPSLFNVGDLVANHSFRSEFLTLSELRQFRYSDWLVVIIVFISQFVNPQSHWLHKVLLCECVGGYIERYAGWRFRSNAFRNCLK